MKSRIQRIADLKTVPGSVTRKGLMEAFARACLKPRDRLRGGQISFATSGLRSDLSRLMAVLDRGESVFEVSIPNGRVSDVVAQLVTAYENQADLRECWGRCVIILEGSEPGSHDLTGGDFLVPGAARLYFLNVTILVV